MRSRIIFHRKRWISVHVCITCVLIFLLKRLCIKYYLLTLLAKISHEVKQYNLELVTADSQGMGILLIIIPTPIPSPFQTIPPTSPRDC